MLNAIIEVIAQNRVMLVLMSEIQAKQVGATSEEVLAHYEKQILKQSQDIRDNIYAENGIVDLSKLINENDKKE